MPNTPWPATKNHDPHSDPSRIRDDFLGKMGGQLQLRQLFEFISGVYFFVKDDRSRLILASSQILDRFGLKHELEIVGTTDYDYFPTHIADRFVADDQRVIQTNRPLLRRVEIWYTEQRLLDWFVTNKLPVHDNLGNVIGVMGTISSYQGSRRSLQSFSQIDDTVEFIRTHLDQKLTVAQLAARVNLSTRQLHRKFMNVLGISVQSFLLKTRIQAASESLLHSDLAISKIAQEVGFCDQSAFTQQFRKATGMTPARFRKRHKSGETAVQPPNA